MRKWIKNVALLGVWVCITVSCSTPAKIIASWSDTSVSPASAQKVLIGSLAGQNYPGIQQEIEESVVEHLKKEGITGVSAIKQFGPAIFEEKNDKKIAALLQEHGFTSVMLVFLLDERKETKYHQGSTYIEPMGMYNSFLRPYTWYYGAVYSRVYTPGYYSSKTNYILDVKLFSLIDNDKLCYSSQINIGDPEEDSHFVREFTTALIENMKKKGLIETPSKR